jgi:hypothetical protein
MSPQEAKHKALNDDRGIIFKVLKKEGRSYEDVLDNLILVIGIGVSLNKVECECLLNDLAQKTGLSKKQIIEVLRNDIKALAAKKSGEVIDKFLSAC